MDLSSASISVASALPLNATHSAFLNLMFDSPRGAHRSTEKMDS
jgi:hypothetical protein